MVTTSRDHVVRHGDKHDSICKDELNQEIIHSWHPADHSKNIYIKDDDPLTFYRRPARRSTDAIRGRYGYTHGHHAWKLKWLTPRGSHAVAGVGSKEAILHCKGYTTLIEQDPNAWGWDITNKISYSAGKKSLTCYPSMALDYQAPSEVIVYLDMENGTLAFEAEGKYLGICCTGLVGKSLYPMVSEVYGNAEVSIIYLGNRRPGQEMANLYTWNPDDCSVNIHVLDDDLHACQRQKAVQSTDAIRCNRSIENGRHVWQLTWQGDLGSHSVAGVGNKKECLHCTGYTSLVGCSTNSWGWNISKRVLIHANIEQGHYPMLNHLHNQNQDGEDGSNILNQELSRFKKFCVILDMDRGTLSYEVNGVNLGIAFHGLQGKILYPMISTIIGDCKVRIDYLGEQPAASNPRTPLLFYSRHGLNGMLSSDFTIASRKNPVSQFDAATFMTNRPLQDNELFQLRIDNVMTRWNGNLQIGLTTASPTSLQFPRSLVGIQQSPNWILSDKNLYVHGQCQNYCHHQGLHSLKMGDYFGISRKTNGHVHAYINGNDLGAIATDVTNNVYGIINLYGNCDCATIVPEGNENIPPEILAHGEDAIAAYNKASQFDCRNVRRIRFVILSKDQLPRQTISKILKGQGNLSPLVEEGGKDALDKKYSFSTIEDEMEKIQEQLDQALAKSIVTKLESIIDNQDIDESNMNVNDEDRYIDDHDICDIEDEPSYSPSWHLSKELQTSDSTLQASQQHEAILNSLAPTMKQIVCKMIENCDIDNHEKNNIEVKPNEEVLKTHDVWDLSGQPIHNLSYRMFCNNKSIYIIAFDLTEDIEESEGNELCVLDFILYWMSSIYSCAVGQNPSRKATLLTPTVFIIGINKNKLGSNITERNKLINYRFDRIQENLRGKPYARHMAPIFFAIDDQLDDDQDEELAKLIQSIDNAVESQPFISEKIPIQWLKFECLSRQMTKEGKHLISSDEVYQLIASESHIIDRSAIKVMLQYYHDLGNIVHYQDSVGNTSNNITVILDPLWLADSFVKILTLKNIGNNFSMKSNTLELLNKRGILTDDLINYMWGDIIDHKSMLLNLMESFDLLCRRLIPRKGSSDCTDYAECGNTYYLPSRLQNPKRIEDIYIHNNWDISFYVDFDGFLPDGFYNRLLMHVVRWTQECGGREPYLYNNCARFYLDEDHDFILHRAPMRFARIKVVVQRANFDDEEEGVVIEVNRQACTKVLQFVKATLANLRKAWIRHLNYQIVVACTCNKLCEKHNINGCQREECLHFHELELCKSAKLVLCDHRRIRTAPYKKWFCPEVKKDKKSLGSLIKSSSKNEQEFEWPHEVTDLLTLPGKANWRTLARKMGYSEIDICNWSLTADPAHAILNDWSKSNTIDDLYQILQSIQRDDVMHIMQEIEINKGIVQNSDSNNNNIVPSDTPSPEIFISYQWDHQAEAKALCSRLGRYGYKCWIDIGQMGGGDILYQKIYDGIKEAQLVIACVTSKYVSSSSCSKEIILADMLGKPIVPVMLEKVDWPPPGAMAISFSQLIYIDMSGQGGGHGGKGRNLSPREKFSEIIERINKYVKLSDEQITSGNSLDNQNDSTNNLSRNPNNNSNHDSSTNTDHNNTNHHNINDGGNSGNHIRFHPYDNISIGSSIFEDALFSALPRTRTTSNPHVSQCCNIL